MQIFLAVSFSSQVDSEGKINPAYKSDLETLIQHLEDAGHSVFCAPREEGWKVTDHDPVHALKWDFEQIDAADAYVAMLDKNVSSGVQLETGYALAHDKRIVIASPSSVELSWTNSALAGFQDVSSVNFEFYDQLAQQILQLISR